MAIPNAQNDGRSLLSQELQQEWQQELQQEREIVQKVLGQVAGGAKQLLHDFDQERLPSGIDTKLGGLRQAVTILEGDATMRPNRTA